MKIKYNFGIIMLLLMMITLNSSLIFAQTADSGTETSLIVTGIITVLFVVLIFFIIFVMNGNVEAIIGSIYKIWAYLIPQKSEKAIQMDEEFDGITELDNRIPPWFNYLFAGTVIFGVVYMINYHVLKTSPLPQEEYTNELNVADLAKRVRLASEGEINEDQLIAFKDEASLKVGKEMFKKNCASCHGPEGGGIVGPNLTDQYWLHGGGIKNVFNTIKNGVPAKGMISWKLVFTPKELQQLASYVLSLQGTNPVGGKPPQGTIWVEPKTEIKDSVKTLSKS